MIIISIIVVSVLLMALFIAVTVAGGKSHDRQNEAESKNLDQSFTSHPPSTPEDY